MNLNKIMSIVLPGLLAACLPMQQIMAQEQIRSWNFNGGVIQSTGEEYSLQSTLGQTFTGFSRNDDEEIRSGFWYMGEAPVVTSVEETGSVELPLGFTLQQNFPNPFNPTTQIRYGIPQASEVQLTVYNMLGQRVATLVDGKQSAGWHTASFDASGLSSGAYIYRIQAGEFTSTKKLTLIK